MQLKLFTTLALKKVRFRKARTFILALPIILLTTIVVTAFSWASGFEQKVTTEFLEPLAQSKQIIALQKFNSEHTQPPEELKGVVAFTNTFTTEELDQFSHIEGVESVHTYPSVNTRASVVIEGIENDNLHTYDLTSLDSSLADLYGLSEFHFQTDQPIPLIAGTSFLNETIYNFGDKTTVVEPRIRNSQTDPPVVIHESHRDLINSQLIGKTGTLSFNLLPPRPEVTFKLDGGTIVKTRLDDHQQEVHWSAFKKLLEPYWNLTLLEQPEEFAFEIVGINTSDYYSNSNFIPMEALVYIQNTLYQRQHQARTSTPLPPDLLQEQIVGNIIQSDTVYFARPQISDEFNEEVLQKPVLPVPGLLVKAVRDATGALGYEEVSGFAFTENHFDQGYATVRIYEDAEREAVISEIMDVNDTVHAGGGEVDLYANIMELVSRALQIVIAALSLIVAVIILILCWGFASDASREVGLLRAIGITGAGARWIVLWQLVLIFGASIIIGVVLSVGFVHLGAGWIADFFNVYFFNHGQDTGYDRAVAIHASDLRSLDIISVTPYLIAATALPVIAAITATRKNLKTDPLEVLKKDY